MASRAARAAACLRRDGLLARRASLSLSTDRHKPGYRRRQYDIRFLEPTADTGRIAGELAKAARAATGPGIRYHRANVLLYDLVGEDALQPDLFGDINPASLQTTHNRLQAFDAINERYGKGALHYAAEDLSQAWLPRQQLRDPRYTTSWAGAAGHPIRAAWRIKKPPRGRYS